MNIQVVDSIPRNVVLSTLKEYNISTPKPAHMMKTEDLLEFLPVMEKSFGKKKDTLKEKIISYYVEGMTVKELSMKFPDIRIPYIYTILRNLKKNS